MFSGKTSFIDEHLTKFQECYPEPPCSPLDEVKKRQSPEGEEDGRYADAWLESIVDNDAINKDDTYKAIVDRLRKGVKQLPPRKMTRSLLLELASRRDALTSAPCIDTSALCIGIFAWGGMHRKNGKLLFERLNHWIGIADQIRNGGNFSEAYGEFAELRQNKDKLSGMGPAYFTKLIYFLAPRSPQEPIGYIMDQWVACSINLLTGRNVVKLNHNIAWKNDLMHKNGVERSKDSEKKRVARLHIDSVVSDENTKENYVEFCGAVEELRAFMEESSGKPWSPESIELALISDGRNKLKKEWRDYLKKERCERFLWAVDPDFRRCNDGTCNQ